MLREVVVADDACVILPSMSEFSWLPIHRLRRLEIGITKLMPLRNVKFFFSKLDCCLMSFTD